MYYLESCLLNIFKLREYYLGNKNYHLLTNYMMSISTFSHLILISKEIKL